MGKQSFLHGAFILSASAFVTRILGFISLIFLSRLLGAEGIGLLMMAQPLIPLIITLTELGLPVAISKLVAEAEVRGDHAKTKRILVVSLLITGTLGITLTTISLLCSKYIAAFLLADQRAYYAMLAITPISPIIAMSAVLKGYFRGKQLMKTIGISDIFENIANIGAILILVNLLLPYGIEYAAAGAMAASVFSEITSLTFLSLRFRIDRARQPKVLTFRQALHRGRETLAELLAIGLPTTGQGFVHSLYGAVQPLLVTFSLSLAGVGASLAAEQFGQLAGYALPLLFLPSFITHSLSTALIPAISEANAQRNSLLMHRTMEQAMRIALFVGAPSTIILFEWAAPLTSLIYNSPEAGGLLKILAPFFFLQYFDGPLHAILLGLGRANAAMWNFTISMAIRTVGILIFGSRLGIEGVAFAIGIGFLVEMILNLFSVSKAIGFYIELRRSISTIVCMLFMAICGQLVFTYLQNSGMALLPSVLLSVAIALACYYLSLLGTRPPDRDTLSNF